MGSVSGAAGSENNVHLNNNSTQDERLKHCNTDQFTMNHTDHNGEVLPKTCTDIQGNNLDQSTVSNADGHQFPKELSTLVNNNDQINACPSPVHRSKQHCKCPDESACSEGTRWSEAELNNMETQFDFKVPGQHYYHGIIMSGLSPLERLNELHDFKVQDQDIIVSGYPKSGTTWLEEIVYLVQHNGDTSLSNKTPIYLRVPYMEGHYDGHMLDSMSAPRVYKTHLPHRLLPDTILKSQTKIIHIIRNPRDTAVSYFHFHRALTELGNYKGTWTQFLDMFRVGYVCYGDWFTHTRQWWSRRHDPNVLVITYENMKRHPQEVIARIAQFCGKDLDESTIDKIAEHTSFDSMKSNPMLNFDGVPNIDVSVSTFMRKGKVGDWKNYFTIAQNEEFRLLYESKLGDVPDLPYKISQTY